MPEPADHYFSSEPAAASRPRTVELVLPGVRRRLAADAGVFSGSRVDPGTRHLLLATPRPPADGDLLDLGCGYGPIAVALASWSPGARVWAVDVNARARRLAAENTADLPGVTVCEPADVPDDVEFAGIWSNPPVRVGKAALHDLLDRWLPRLAPAAAAYLVVHKSKGSDSLARWLGDERGSVVERLASRQGYRVLEVRRG